MTNLNEQQMSAVLCEDRRILCLAGAGTGKTTVMLERISHLVNQGVSPSSILVMTFTNAAAFEMKDRYRRSHPAGLIPEFRTYHGFCYHVLATNFAVRKHLGYRDIPVIATDYDRKKIVREASVITGIKSSYNTLENKLLLSAKEKYDYDTLKKTIVKLLQKENWITFDILCTEVCKLFFADSEIIKMYKDQYKYVFVDEFQDTDPIQNDFVQSFVDSNIFVVGDALQSLYSFRGASSAIIKGLSTNPEWHTIKLYQNYRSPKTICDFANEHSKYANDSFRVAIESGLNLSGEPVTCKSAKSFGYGNISRNNIDYCIDDFSKYPGSTAVLCRTNREVKYVQDYFDSKGVPYYTYKKSDEVEHILKSVIDNEYLLNWLISYLTAECYADYIRKSTFKSSENKEYTLEEFLMDFGMMYAIQTRWEIVKSLRRICKSTSDMETKIQQILEKLDCKYLTIDSTKCTTLKDAIFYIIEQYNNSEETPGTDIYVGTVHSVKGLEFDNVYVLGVNDLTFQLNNEENKNIYYVAITRAKKHLVVFEKRSECE